LVNIDKIKSLAKEKGVSITFLCQAIGQGAYYFNDVKKRNGTIPDDRMEKICDILGTTVDYLTDKTEQKEKPTQADRADYMTQLFRKLSDKNKDILIEIMEKMLEGENNND
jgi:transcriptional regulator with XRE-family HTH domain